MQTIDIQEVKQEVVDKMEQYKQEFIEFSVMFCLLPLKIPIKLVFMRFV